MKRRILNAALAGAILSLACVTAVSAETVSGVYLSGVDSGKASMTVQTSSGQAGQSAKLAESDSSTIVVYPVSKYGWAKINVTLKNTTAGKYYLVLALNDTSKTPSSGNIVYLDQATADGSNLIFTVYPSDLPTENTPYKIYLTSNENGSGLVEIGTISYANNAFAVEYITGNINDDDYINATDASLALQIAAGILENVTAEMRAAANVNGDEYVNATDASLILQFGAGLIKEWPVGN